MAETLRLISPMERALYLRSLHALSGLSSEALSLLAQNAKERRFRKDAAIVKRGEGVGSFHFIVEGRVRAQGGEHGDTVLEPRTILGYYSMLSEKDEELDAVAETEVVTLEVDSDEIRDVFEDQFDVLHHEIEAVAGRMLSLRRDIPDGTYLAPGEGLLEPASERLDLMERVLWISRGAAWGRTSMDTMIELARQMEEVRLEAGTTFWRPGDPSGYFLLVVDGVAKCMVEEGARSFRAGPGYPLGNLESMAGAPRWYHGVTETPMIALRGDMEVYLDVLEDHFDVAFDLFRSFATSYIRLAEENRRQSVGLPA